MEDLSVLTKFRVYQKGQAHLTSTCIGNSFYMQPTPLPCMVPLRLWPVWGPLVHPNALHLIVFVTTCVSPPPRIHAEGLGTQFRRGPWNAGREAGAALWEGPLECGQGRCGHTMGGVPWNAGREAEALT